MAIEQVAYFSLHHQHQSSIVVRHMMYLGRIWDNMMNIFIYCLLLRCARLILWLELTLRPASSLLSAWRGMKLNNHHGHNSKTLPRSNDGTLPVPHADFNLLVFRWTVRDPLQLWAEGCRWEQLSGTAGKILFCRFVLQSVAPVKKMLPAFFWQCYCSIDCKNTLSISSTTVTTCKCQRNNF